MNRPWSHLPISDCCEALFQLKPSFYCLEPHPYASIGAPYEECVDPWRLRQGVAKRLFLAQDYLQLECSDTRLAIFDALRPISVQAYMVNRSIDELCLARGVERNNQNQQYAFNEIVQEVGMFWAPPSHDPRMPPPHSTGAAVDLTLADSKGGLLDMGGDIDVIAPISSPNFYLDSAKSDVASNLFHQRRTLLAKAMKKAGFVQHPNEWWHFSYGDQLWAWISKSPEAFYGGWPPSVNKESTRSSPRS